MQGNSARSIAPENCQEIDDGLMMRETRPAVDGDWLSGVPRKTNTQAERDYRRNRGVNAGNHSTPADVSVDVLDDLGDLFSQEVLWEGDSDAFFTAHDRSVIASALARLSKTDLNCGVQFAFLVKDLVGEVEASQAATTKAKKEVEWQKGIVSDAKKLKNNALNYVACL